MPFRDFVWYISHCSPTPRRHLPQDLPSLVHSPGTPLTLTGPSLGCFPQFPWGKLMNFNHIIIPFKPTKKDLPVDWNSVFCQGIFICVYRCQENPGPNSMELVMQHNPCVRDQHYWVKDNSDSKFEVLSSTNYCIVCYYHQLYSPLSAFHTNLSAKWQRAGGSDGITWKLYKPQRE